MLISLQVFFLTANATFAVADHNHGRLEKQIITDPETGKQDHYILYTYNDAGLLSGRYWYTSDEDFEDYIYYSEEYDYYKNDMLRTRWHSGLFGELHYDVWGHYMDCDYDIIDTSGVPCTDLPSDVVREYDADGNLTRYEAQWNYEEGTADDESIVREYEYDENNRIVTVKSTEYKPNYYSKQRERITNYVKISFSYWEDGSYSALIERDPADKNYWIATLDYIEFNENGFPLREVGFREYDDEIEGISVVMESHYAYDEYGNLTQIHYEYQDGFLHTIDYLYQMKNGKPIYCDVIDLITSGDIDEEPVIYTAEYKYNADGELVREGIAGNYKDYTYIYDESAEPPTFWPDDLKPFAPLFPWG